MITVLTLALSGCGGGKATPTTPGEPTPSVQVDFTSIDASSTEVAGYAVGFTGDWQDLHARLKREARRLSQPTEVNPTPTGQLRLYVVDSREHVPDLKAHADGDLPLEHVLALYDNKLTGEWRFCFGGLRGAADMATCVYDADLPDASAYALPADE
jgi:hypothetical protein